MNMNARATIESALTEGASHLERLRDSEKRLKQMRPFTARSLESIGTDDVLHLDQFIYRFTKLQDSMARRLLPSVYVLLEGDTAPKPFLDVLHRLEQLGVIPSVSRWQQLRNLRNNLAHDYPENLQQTADTLNELLETWSELETIHKQTREAYRKRI